MDNYPVINGHHYSWASVSVSLFGRTLVGIQSINYKSAAAVEPVYGAGTRVIGSTLNGESYSGSIILIEEEYRAITRSLPKGKKLWHIKPFDITVVMEQDGRLVTDVVKGCRFMESEFKASNGSTGELVRELPLFVIDIIEG